MAPFLGLFSSLFATGINRGKSVINIVEDFREIYRSLDNASIPRIECSPTVRFYPVKQDLELLNYTRPSDREHTTQNRRELIRTVAEGHNNTKKVAVYLPGLDGTGISAYKQFPDLAREFEFWRMVVDTHDRSSFLDLSNHVCSFIDDLVNSVSDVNREVILIGESFGGLLAPSVAIRRSPQSGLKGLVLVNPATSFEETGWSLIAPYISSLARSDNSLGANFPSVYSIAGGVALASTIPDETQFRQILDIILSISVKDVDDLARIFEGSREGFKLLEERLPPKTLDHRIEQWCIVGCQVVRPRLSRIMQKTLIVAGKQDKMLPTDKEAGVLAREICNATKIEFNDSGHYILDERVNLTSFIIDADFFPAPEYDPLVDWKPPTRAITDKKIKEQVKPLRQLTGPVFFSTDAMGRRHKGVGKFPSTIQTGGKPVLIVANHQLVGLDLSLIVSELIEQRDIYPRGLAHPILFAGANFFGGDGGGGGGNNMASDYKKYGAVQVSPRNYYRLMETGQTAMLFPGGVREVFHGKDEAYQLFWPENKIDFVRTAARFNATIVPLSAIGAADSANILIDAPDMLNLPFGLGDRVANASRSIMPARFDMDNEGELFAAPLLAPGIPARHYFVFGKPFDTTLIDPKNKDQCKELFQNVKSELERGIDDLLRSREQDPYRDISKRILYEIAFGKPAPTFPVMELNK